MNKRMNSAADRKYVKCVNMRYPEFKVKLNSTTKEEAERYAEEYIQTMNSLLKMFENNDSEVAL